VRYDIETTAAFHGLVTVCLGYPDPGRNRDVGLKLLHYRVEGGVATGGDALTLTDSNPHVNWTIDPLGSAPPPPYALWHEAKVRILSGVGVGQVRDVISNTADTLTVDQNWAVSPGAGSQYEIEGWYDLGGQVDNQGKYICASTTKFSPFAVVMGPPSVGGLVEVAIGGDAEGGMPVTVASGGAIALAVAALGLTRIRTLWYRRRF